MNKMNENLDKLPKWAQSRIRVAESNAERERLRANAFTGIEATSIEIEPHKLDGEQRRYLPNHTTIRFHLNEDTTVDIRLERNRVHISGHNMRRRFNVQPGASNVVTIGYGEE